MCVLRCLCAHCSVRLESQAAVSKQAVGTKEREGKKRGGRQGAGRREEERWKGGGSSGKEFSLSERGKIENGVMLANNLA